MFKNGRLVIEFNKFTQIVKPFRVLNQFNWLRARDLFGIPDPFYLNGKV